MSAFPRSCLALSPHMCACVGWVRLPAVLSLPVLDGVSAFPTSCLPLSPIVSPHWCLCWMVSPPWIMSAFKRPCRPLSLIVSPHVCLCWMLCPPSRGLVSFCLPTCVPVLDGVSPFARSCLPLSPIVPTCVPVLDGASTFPRFCLPLSLPLSPFLFPWVGWCVRLPEVLSPLSPSLSLNLSLFLFPFVAGGLILFFPKECTVRGSSKTRFESTHCLGSTVE